MKAPAPKLGEYAVSALIPIGPQALAADLLIPERPKGVVLFVHGSGSSRLSSRNREVARLLRESNFATLLFDLFTTDEPEPELLPFDLDLLASRVVATARWAATDPRTSRLPVGCIGSSSGAAVALVAAGEMAWTVRAVVSRGGRPDLVGPRLKDVRVPTRLIVGSRDEEVAGLNRLALESLGASEKDLKFVPGASHLFEEPGCLEEAARLASEWFTRFLPVPPRK